MAHDTRPLAIVTGASAGIGYETRPHLRRERLRPRHRRRAASQEGRTGIGGEIVQATPPAPGGVTPPASAYVIRNMHERSVHDEVTLRRAPPIYMIAV